MSKLVSDFEIVVQIQALILPFKQGVRGSIPRRVTRNIGYKALKLQRFWGFIVFSALCLTNQNVPLKSGLFRFFGVRIGVRFFGVFFCDILIQTAGGVLPLAMPNVGIHVPGDGDTAVSQQLLGVLVRHSRLV